LICLQYCSNSVYDRSVWLAYNTVQIVNTVSMIGLCDLFTVQF
jgi:hypothetical protein